MTAQRRKQLKEESEKNFRISTWRWILFQKMCMFPLQGLTRLAAYPISILCFTEPWFGWWEGGTVFPTSRRSEGGYILANEMHWSHLGSWEIHWKLACPFCLLAHLSSLWKEGCDPEGGPSLLQVNSSQVKQAKLKGRRAVIFSLDSCVTKCITDLLKPLFIQGFHYVQLKRLLTGKWFILNFPWESKPYIFTSFSFMVLITFSN